MFVFSARKSGPLSHWTPVKLHYGATEVVARAVILADSSLVPGGDGVVQFVMERHTATAVGDKFVIRDISDQRTMGGGRFIDLRAPARKRRSPQRIAQLHGCLEKSPTRALETLLGLWPHYVNLTAFARDRALGLSQTNALVERLGLVLLSQGPDKLALSSVAAATLRSDILSILEDYHRRNAGLLGIGFEKLRIRLEPRLPAPALNEFLQGLVKLKLVIIEGASVRLVSHAMQLTFPDEWIWQKILPLLSGQGRFRPPRSLSK